MPLDFKWLFFLGQLSFLLVFEFQVLQIQLFLLRLIIRLQVVIFMRWGVVVYSDALPRLDIVNWVGVGVQRVVLIFKGARRVKVGKARFKAWLASWLLIMRGKLIVELLIEVAFGVSLIILQLLTSWWESLCHIYSWFKTFYIYIR